MGGLKQGLPGQRGGLIEERLQVSNRPPHLAGAKGTAGVKWVRKGLSRGCSDSMIETSWQGRKRSQRVAISPVPHGLAWLGPGTSAMAGGDGKCGLPWPVRGRWEDSPRLAQVGTPRRREGGEDWSWGQRWRASCRLWGPREDEVRNGHSWK